MANKGKQTGSSSTTKKQETQSATTSETVQSVQSVQSVPSVSASSVPTTSKSATPTAKNTKNTKSQKQVSTSESETKTETQTPVQTFSETQNTTDTTQQAGSYDDKFEEYLSQIETTYQEARKQLHLLYRSVQRLKTIHRSDLKRAKVKKTKRTEKHKPTGFARTRPIPEKMASFIGVEPGTELTGPEITRKVWGVLKDRNLTFENDKRVLRVDNEVSNLFFVPMSVNDSTQSNDENGFNFGNLQFYIKQGLEGKRLERKKKNENTKLLTK